MPSRLSPSRIVDLAAMASAVAMTAFVYFLGIEPILNDRSEHHQQQQAYAQLQEQARQREHELRIVRGHYARVMHTLEQQPLDLQPLQALNRRLNDVASLGRRMELSIERIRPGQAEDKRHYHQLPIEIQGHGSFLHATAFLHQVKQYMPDLGVRSLQLTGDPRNLDSTNLDFTIELIWYASPATRAERLNSPSQP